MTPEQIAELQKPLDRKHVKTRKQGSAFVSYVEGYHVENEANRIFGFDGWDRTTVEMKCVSERERQIGRPPNTRDGWGVSYICRVRIRVTCGAAEIIREGYGAGHGIDMDLGLAHESAAKEAETDAQKRALKTFGNPFGQALYDKEQREVEDVIETIDDGQLAQLQTLFQQSGGDAAKTLAHFKIPSLDKLPADKFDGLAKKLRERINEQSEQKDAEA